MSILDLATPLPWIALAGAAGAAALTAGIITHKVDDSAMQRHLLADAQASEKAAKASAQTERSVAVVDDRHSGAAAAAQTKIVTHTITLTQEVPIYVHDEIARACVPWGVVRLFDASALGLDASVTGPPPGTSDDACSPVATADLANAIVANHGIARQNAAQLDALEADIRERTSAFNAPPQ